MFDEDQRSTDPSHVAHSRFGPALNIEHSSFWGLQSVDWEHDFLISVRIFFSQNHVTYNLYFISLAFLSWFSGWLGIMFRY